MTESEIIAYGTALAIGLIFLFTAAGVIHDLGTPWRIGQRVNGLIWCRIMGHWYAADCSRPPCIHCGRMKKSGGR